MFSYPMFFYFSSAKCGFLRAFLLTNAAKRGYNRSVKFIFQKSDEKNQPSGDKFFCREGGRFG